MTSGSDRAFAIAGDHVLAKGFEEELTLVNLDSGEYFAAGGVACELWAELAVPVTLADLEQMLAARYAVDRDVVVQAVRSLMDSFSKHGLIVPVEAVPAPPSRSVSTPERRPWTGVWFEVYGDLKDLLLLDPVHDVDGGAWPPSQPVS
jgi:hypothetical protein